MARRSYSLLQAQNYVMCSVSKDEEKSSALDEETLSTHEDTSSSEDDSITGDDEEYQPVPDSFSSVGEEDTDTAVKAKQLMVWQSSLVARIKCW